MILLATKTMSTSGRRTSMRKFRNCVFLHSVRLLLGFKVQLRTISVS